MTSSKTKLRVDTGADDPYFDPVFVGTKKVQRDDNQLLFINIGLGNKEQKTGQCAMITFFQFVRATRIDFDTFYNEWLKDFIDDVYCKSAKTNNERLMKIIKPIWDGIYKGKYKNWKAITYHDVDSFKYYLFTDESEKDEEKMQELKQKGLPLYKLINNFERLIFTSLYSIFDYKVMPKFN